MHGLPLARLPVNVHTLIVLLILGVVAVSLASCHIMLTTRTQSVCYLANC